MSWRLPILIVLIAVVFSWGVSLVAGPFKKPKGRGNVPDVLEQVRQPKTLIPDVPQADYHPIAASPGRIQKDLTSWTFKHDGSSGPEGSVTEFQPIELSIPKTIALQLLFDATVRGASRFDPEPGITEVIYEGNYDDTQALADPGDDTFRILVDGVSPHVDFVFGDHTIHPDPHTAPKWLLMTHIMLGRAGATIWNFEVTGVDTTNPDYVVVHATNLSPLGLPLGSWEEAGFPGGLPLVNGDFIAVTGVEEVPPTEVKPNAAVRARVRYSAGKAEDISFECDWRGEIELVASRVELSRVVFKPDDAAPFHETSLKLRAIATLDGPTPRIPATYTVPAVNVNAGAYRSVPLPALAQRVSVLARYGGDPEDVGDVPLGQIFVSFATETGNAMGYIDAMSAREALFGLGLSIPAGAVDLLLVNLSADPIDLGAIFHLGV